MYCLPGVNTRVGIYRAFLRFNHLTNQTNNIDYEEGTMPIIKFLFRKQEAKKNEILQR